MIGSATVGDVDSAVPPPAALLVGLSILLVEDDLPLLDSTAQAISALGHVVYRAANAAQARACLEASSVDVLMTDINLPDMSGEVLAAEARELEPHIKIVFVTGRSDIRDPVADGVDPWLLRKPYDLAAIAALLQALTV